jgi:hypothetical protein
MRPQFGILPAWYLQLCNLGNLHSVVDSEEKILLNSEHQSTIASCQFDWKLCQYSKVC